MEDIKAFMEANQVKIRFASSDTNPFMPGYSGDMNHWFCNITAASVEPFDFYYSTSQDLQPDADMALQRLIEDIEQYKECEGYENFLSLFDIDEGDGESDLAVAWAELERLEPMVTQLTQQKVLVQTPQGM